MLYYKHPLVGFVQSAESDLSMPVIVRGAESKVVTEMHAMLAKYPRYLAPTMQEPANLEHIQLSYQNEYKIRLVFIFISPARLNLLLVSGKLNMFAID